MSILKKITDHKRQIVQQAKQQQTLASLENSPFFQKETHSLKKRLLANSKQIIIAEFKKQSPSKGIINNTAKVATVTKGYEKAGVAGISILTDTHFFGGKNTDLVAARKAVNCPILRKDFIIDPYQIAEAKAIGADVILLIAECLERQEVADLAAYAKELGLEVLMEIHAAEQLDKLCAAIDIVGVNNRNLKTFEVSIQTSIDLFAHIPTEFAHISESGLQDAESIVRLQNVGYQGFLVGEQFMKSADPVAACEALIQEIDNFIFSERPPLFV